MRINAISFLFLLFIGGCGYHVQGRGDNLPPDVRTVYIEIFANKTLEPFLDTIVSEFVTERFIRGRLLRVVDRPDLADAVLSGEAATYLTSPVAYDRRDEIARYGSSMTVSARLVRTGSKEVLWKGIVSWNEEYPASPDKNLQEDNEAAAIRVISERLAEEVYFRLGDNF